MELCEFKASLIFIVSSGQPGLYSEDISSKKKEKEEREEGRKEEKNKTGTGKFLGIVALDKLDHYEESQADTVKPQENIAASQKVRQHCHQVSGLPKSGDQGTVSTLHPLSTSVFQVPGPGLYHTGHLTVHFS